MSSSNSENLLDNICKQWVSSLALNICHSLEGDQQSVQNKISALPNAQNTQAVIQLLQENVKVMGQYEPKIARQMMRSLEFTLFDYAEDSKFPHVFSLLVPDMHTLLVLPYSGNQKAKALHSEQVLQQSNLSPFEELKVHVFTFLSKLLGHATESQKVNLNSLDLKIIQYIFRFIEHDQPNEVRTAAGQIVSAISTIPEHCNSVIELFWTKFTKCKKDEDYRNFAALIDGITNLSFSLATIEYQKVVVGFFKSFLDNAKKIERGVLRIKFLEALTVIIKKLNMDEKAATVMEYTNKLDDIWKLVTKWSSKGKHTQFCYQFLQGMLTNSFPSFFVTQHGQTFLDMVIKHAKNEPDDALVLLVDWVKSVPSDYVRNDDFRSNMNETIFPLLFPINKDGNRTLKFKSPKQSESLISIVADTAIKQMEVFMQFVKPIMEAQQPQNSHDAEALKKLKVICLHAISSLAQLSPDVLAPVASQLNPYIEPVISNKDSPEFEFILPTFPLIKPSDNTKCKQIVELLYEISFSDNEASSNAFSSLCKYIEQNVKLDENMILPFSFMKKSITGVSLMSEVQRLKTLSLLIGLAEVTSKTLQLYSAQFSTIQEGRASITTIDIKDLFMIVNHEILAILISPSPSDREVASNLICMFNNDVYNSLAEIAFENEEYFSLAKFVSEIDNNIDFIKAISQIPKQSQHASTDYFEYLVQYFTNNKDKIGQDYEPRLFVVLSSLCITFNEVTKQFFQIMFNNLRENPTSPNFLSLMQILSDDLWYSLCQAFSTYQNANNFSPNNFWPQIVSFYSALTNRNEFRDHLTDENFDTFLKLFVDSTWKTVNERENTQALTEKALKIVSTYIDHHDPKQVIEDTDASNYITFILTSASIDQKAQASFVDVVLSNMHRVFSYTKLTEISQFIPVSDYLVKACELYPNDDRVQYLICEVLSDFLRVNSILLKHVFSLIFSNDSNMTSNSILAIGNAYQVHEDFGEFYEDGHARMFATTILHMSNEIIKPRQAAFKLMCLMLTRNNDIFEAQAPLDLMMPLTSPSPTGYQIQAKQFSEFASTSIKPESALIAFRMIADEMGSMKQKHKPLLDSLLEVSPVLAKAKPLKDVALTLIRITAQSDIDNAGISESIKLLWLKFSEAVKSTNDSSNINELLQTIFEYGSTQEDMKSKGSQSSVIVLCYIFLVFPEETTNSLMPILMNKYQVTLPELESLEKFFGKAALTFTPTKQEIIAANALSQIFLMIDDKNLFKKLFKNEIPSLLMISIIIRSEESMTIGKFHPLLESLIDAALFRFSESTDTFSSNLKALQESNLIQRATTLDPQYRIITEEGSRSVLAYDEKAIRTLVNLFQQATDENLLELFFGALLSLSCQVDREDGRASEPFLILMHIGEYMTSSSLFLILLYTLYCNKNNQIQLLDCIIDCIRSHLVTPDIDKDSFISEAMPVIIVLILYLSMKLKSSQSLHVMKVLSEIILNVHSRFSGNDDNEVFHKVVKYMAKFNGDEYISSIMCRYILELKSFGDPTCAEIIRCLASLSIVYNSPNNWCMLLADLADGARYFIGECGGKMADKVLTDRKYNSPEEFANIFYETYKDNENQIRFVLSFICNILCTSESLDLNKESATLLMLRSIIQHKDALPLPQEMTEKLITFLSLISMSCDQKYKLIAAPLIVDLMRKSTTKISAQVYSYIAIQPKFATLNMRQYNSFQCVQRTLIDPSALPQFKLFNISGIELTVITDLWDFIIDKIEENDEGHIIYIREGKKIESVTKTIVEKENLPTIIVVQKQSESSESVHEEEKVESENDLQEEENVKLENIDEKDDAKSIEEEDSDDS